MEDTSLSLDDFRHLASLPLPNHLRAIYYENLCVTSEREGAAVVFAHDAHLENVDFEHPVRLFFKPDRRSSHEALALDWVGLILGMSVVLDNLENVAEVSFSPGKYRQIEIQYLNRRTHSENNDFHSALRFDQGYDKKLDIIFDSGQCETSPMFLNVMGPSYFDSVGTRANFRQALCFKGRGAELVLHVDSSANTIVQGLCCTNRLRDSLFESSVIAGCHEQLVTYEVQDQELAFVQHGAEAARFSCNLV